MKEVCSEVMAERQLLGIVVLEFAFLHPGNEWWGGLECQFAHVTRQNLREMASSATIARREAFQKASLHTSFGFARLCQKGTFPHAPHFTPPRLAPPRTPHIARHTPRGRTGAPARRRTGTLAPRPCTAVVMATYCHHDGNPWPS